MSASESAPRASDLHTSIEQLIAETVKQVQVSSDAEKQQLTNALQSALVEIESGQQALDRAATALRSALGEAAKPSAPIPALMPEAVIKEAPAETGAPTTIAVRGEHELDVIAHQASIGIASGLQAMLRAQPEVSSAHTREFVNGELRLHVNLTNGLDMDVFNRWLDENGGSLVTTTDSVIEVRFTG